MGAFVESFYYYGGCMVVEVAIPSFVVAAVKVVVAEVENGC